MNGQLPSATVPAATVQRRDRLTIKQAPDQRNSLVLWHQTVTPFKVLRNGLLIMLARHSPSLAFKRWLYRGLGMQVGGLCQLCMAGNAGFILSRIDLCG